MPPHPTGTGKMLQMLHTALVAVAVGALIISGPTASALATLLVQPARSHARDRRAMSNDAVPAPGRLAARSRRVDAALTVYICALGGADVRHPPAQLLSDVGLLSPGRVSGTFDKCAFLGMYITFDYCWTLCLIFCIMITDFYQIHFMRMIQSLIH